MRYDLHAHSDCSDGRLTPEALVERAKAQGVDVLALTDHDTTAGVVRATRAAKAVGMRLIPAVEISARWRNKDIHIVGLNIDHQDAALQAHLARQLAQRVVRAEAIGKCLARLGIHDAFEGAKQIAGQAAAITRPHFAEFLLQQGHVGTISAAFKRYLAAGKAAFVPTAWADMSEVVQWIDAAGGEAVLAHPVRYKLSNGQLRHLLTEFKTQGGVAMEVVTGHQAPADLARMASLAVQTRLLASVGSDFHGIPGQVWLELGRMAPLPTTCTPIWDTWHNQKHASVI